MLPLYDMLANARDGQGFDLLARQFDINRQQAELAVEALLPAFSQGLKRNASDPYGVGAFLQALSSGRHAKYFEDPADAFTPQGMAEGNGILGHLFGSKELSRAVASQAAQATGLGQDMLKQMLPVIASMLMGGLFKQTSGQMPGSQAAPNPFQEIIEQMMRQGAGGMRAPQYEAPQPGANPFDNPFGQILEGMFGGGGAQGARAPRAPQSPYGENPFGRMFEEMLRGAQPRTEAPEPEPEPDPDAERRSPYDDLFGQMFETGRQTRDDYQKSMESVFDQFLKGMERHR
ncbi:MAG: DUF937 domain-containing protein [Rhizobiaceae bacterium]|nr:DUF937 domain-containing protein [Rhizobiaceae bacterium]MCV0406113.1 DUF937 domain-containing protein [Rhizobiaceae bacterium]